MKRISVLLLSLLLLFCGCTSSAEQKLVQDTIAGYFSFLCAGDYASANALAVQTDEKIASAIEKNEINDYIFQDISYEIWGIEKNREDGLFYVDLVVRQLSLKKVYENTVEEYNDYIIHANTDGKIFTDEALEAKWNEIFLKHIKQTYDRTSLRCTVPVRIEEASAVILMTAQFRNCLFGGELDAINALKDAS